MSTSSLIDTVVSLESLCLEWLTSYNVDLYVDLEGRLLSRHGTIDLVQIHDERRNHTYVVDATTLGRSAFEVTTLEGVFESDRVKKYFFDVRNDSDALWGLYGVLLQNVQDLQLYELATRSGLGKCIEQDVSLSFDERVRFKKVKDAGCRLFAPELGGTYDVWAARPLSQELMAYSVQDVAQLPKLRQTYEENLVEYSRDGGRMWTQRCEMEARKRVQMCLGAEWNGEGRHRALAPTDW